MDATLYEDALTSTKSSLESVSEALGFSLGSLSLGKVLSAAITLLLCLVGMWLLMRMARRVSARSTHLSESLRAFLLRALKIALEFIILLIVADSLGINVTSLLAVFSLLGLAVTLSVQNCLSNLMSGITILLTKPFEDGDFIEAGVSGTVKDIGLMYTQLQTLDNKVIYIPNSDLSASKITNYSKEPFRRVELTFGADYGCAVADVKAALLDAVAQVDGVLSEPEAPFARVQEYAASNVVYVVRVWCRNADYWSVYYDLLEAVDASFRAAGVAMSYEHVNVHVMNTEETK